MSLSQASIFPHVLRTSTDYVDYIPRLARASAPRINTLPGDWRNWHRASPEYIELPCVSIPTRAEAEPRSSGAALSHAKLFLRADGSSPALDGKWYHALRASGLSIEAATYALIG